MSGRTSANTGLAPRSTNAFAVETNVNDGHDHLVARLDVEQQRRHLERVRARRRQQRALRAELGLEQLLASPRERAVARDVAVRDRLADEVELVAQRSPHG